MKSYLNKGISTPLAIGIILVLAVIVAGITLAYQYWWVPDQEVEIEETSSNIYRNENGGYIVIIPSDLSIKHTTAEAGETWPDFIDSLEITSNDSAAPAEWRIEVLKNTAGLTADQRVEQIFRGSQNQNKVVTDINIEGIEGKKLVIDYLPTDLDPENTITNATSIFIVKDNNIYEFFCMNKTTQNSRVKDYDTLRFDQMLSTFKFIKTQASNVLKDDIRNIDLSKFAVEAGIAVPELSQKINASQYADLDNDGKEEAAFTAFSGGSSGSFGPFVVKLKNNVPVQLKIDSDPPISEEIGSSWGHVSFFIVKSRLIKYFPLYKSGDANCCPSAGLRYILYKWDNSLSKFVAEKAINLEPEWLNKTYDESNEEAIKRFGL
ncbi:MAG: hypothetical protein PHI53_02155 [Candidatus Pacebacteria bacterium]|nr:hypothetical protein [Candidatus Paceibacterota bacterium]